MRLLDQLRQEIRYLHYSIRTEQAYVHWVRAFVRFHGLRHPAELGHSAVEAFLTWLATEQQVSVSTHKQALSALLFLYQKVLRLSVPWLDDIARPQRAPRLPVVLSHDEVARVLAALPDGHRLFGQLLYGTGMRLIEASRLRVKDIEFERRAIIVREGKGAKDRVVMLPASLDQPLLAAAGSRPRHVVAGPRRRRAWRAGAQRARPQVPTHTVVVGLVLGLPPSHLVG